MKYACNPCAEKTEGGFYWAGTVGGRRRVSRIDSGWANGEQRTHECVAPPILR